MKKPIQSCLTITKHLEDQICKYSNTSEGWSTQSHTCTCWIGPGVEYCGWVVSICLWNKLRLQTGCTIQERKQKWEGKGKRSDPVIYNWAANVCPYCCANSSHTHSYPEDNLQLWKTGRMPPVETTALCPELCRQMLFQLLFYISTLSQKSPSSKSKKKKKIRGFGVLTTLFWCVPSKCA